MAVLGTTSWCKTMVIWLSTGGGSNTAQWASNMKGFKTKATNLSAESSDSASVENIGAMTMQDALPSTTVGIVHFDHDPNTAGSVAVGAPDQASNLTVGGTN